MADLPHIADVEHEPPGNADRVDSLEAAVTALSASIDRLDERITRLEAAAAARRAAFLFEAQ